MNKITLEKIQSTGSCTHVKITINNSEVGALYLKEDELDILLSCLKKGIYSSDTQLTSNLFDDDETFDLDEDEENE